MSDLAIGLRALWARIPWRIVRFGLVGGVATLLYSGLAYLFTVRLAMAAVPGSMLAYFVCTLFSYAAHRRVTFRSDRPVAEEAPRFAGISLLGWIVAIISPLLLTSICGLPPLVAILFVSVAVPTMSFLGMERFVFRGRTQDNVRSEGVSEHDGTDRNSTAGASGDQ